ncbi:MAG: tRNA threonylcarbamoyladenosine dehydratase [Bacillota bacterium]
MKFNRLENLIGKDKLVKLKNKNVVVFGLGGVGSFAAEALIRSGIENLTVVDYDIIHISNINRQLIALETNINTLKIETFKNRALSINSDLNLKALNIKVNQENIKEILNIDYDFALDCIDDVDAKVAIANTCLNKNIPIILSMGFANKFHPEKIKISSLKNTSVCPLAKTMRKKFREKNLSLEVAVVYSMETPARVIDPKVLGSTAFCPSVAGLFMASFVVNKFIESEELI